MLDNNILDQPEPEEQNEQVHRTRSKRFFYYALGLSLLICVHFVMLFHNMNVDADFERQVLTINYIFSIGIAGVWLFTGMGLVASLRALRTGQINLIMLLLLILHGTLFILSTTYLLKIFKLLELFN